MYEVVYFKFWARCNFIATVEEVEGRNIIRFVVEYFQNEVVSETLLQIQLLTLFIHVFYF